MSERTYPLLLANPLSEHSDTIKALIASGDLLLIDEVPSVTTITGAGGVSFGLVYSAANLAKQGKDFRAEWNASAERGTKVHEVAESVALFGAPAVVEDFEEDLQPYVQAVNAWFQLHKPFVLETEFMVFADGPNPPDTRYAGRADLLANISRKKTLVDFKTVGAADHLTKYPKAFQPNHVEVVARAMALAEMNRPVEQCAIVRFSPDGKHHTVFIYPDEWPELYASFLRLRAEWLFKKRCGWQ